MNEPENLRQFWLEVKYKFMVEHHPWMLSSEIQSQVSQESSKYVDKGNWYNLLNDHLEECAGKAREWLTTKQICEVINADG